MNIPLVEPKFLGTKVLTCGLTMTTEVNQYQVTVFTFYKNKTPIGHMYYTRGGDYRYEVFCDLRSEARRVNSEDEAALWLIERMPS